MSDKLFPIRSATACRLKWSWSTLYLNDGMTASCHRASWSKLSLATFNQFHNTPEKIAARETMLAGQWPDAGCEYCRRIEEAGGESDRMFQNLVPNVYPEELDRDPTAVSVQPKILEVFFQNTCNLACLYCRSGLSSRIQNENKTFSFPLEELRGIKTKNEENEGYLPLVEKFWKWLTEHSNTLQRINVLGGEPLLQDEFFQLIKFFHANPNPELELSVTTNLMVGNKLLAKLIKEGTALVNTGSIKRVEVLASVEGLGAEQEYVRYGFNTTQFKLNFEQLMQTPFRLGLLSTINILSMPGLPTLTNQFLEWNKSQKIYWYLHSVIPHGDEDLLSISHYPTEWYAPFIEESLSMLPDSDWDLDQTKKAMQGILSKGNAGTKSKKMEQQLIAFLDEVDRRRHSSWQKVFNFG